jgi:hypothetical protein
MRLSFVLIFSLFLSACSTTYENKDVLGTVIPDMEGETLEKERVEIPSLFQGSSALLLVGYKQDSQFDIDRWLIGLDMTQTKVNAYEIPAIQGMFPRMFKPFINNGMRAGIPKELWKGVITLYKDGEAMQKYTGNENGNNARVLLIDDKGQVKYFYDRGFSVEALNNVRKIIESSTK